MRVEEIDRPQLQDPEDAILRVTTAAICGSDLHLYHGKVPKVTPGMVVGHEFMGIVESVGEAVRLVKPGQRCVASMFTACGRCEACLAGHHLGCARYALFGYGELFGGLDGGQAEYVRVPLADMTLAPVPDGLADEDILFTGDILATAYTGCIEVDLQPGETVAIVGAGPVGQLAVQCAQLFSPAAVYVVDLVAERLAEAAVFGAIPIDASVGDPADQLRELTGGRRADVVLEAVGNAATLATAWRLAATGARIGLIGFLVDEPFPVSAGNTWLRGLAVHPVLGQPIRHRATLTRLIGAKRLLPGAIITERVPLAEAAEAYARLDRREATKLILDPQHGAASLE